VLSVSRLLSQELRSRGARVVMTRSSDVFIELNDRARMAERYKAELFVSVHADSAANRAASGAEVYLYTGATGMSQRAALCIVRAFQRNGIETRGTQRKNLHVLREHSRPAVLVECGFLSNPGDEQKLNTASHQSRLASVIAEGIADALR
jgi:N-acetylmuramoyl-L-alanine amidase